MKKYHFLIAFVLAVAAVASAITLMLIYRERICALLESFKDTTADAVARCRYGLKKDASLFEDIDAED